ncbi:MAG: hypothetical protein R2837_03710 [Aliarcobacter sp.]
MDLTTKSRISLKSINKEFYEKSFRIYLSPDLGGLELYIEKYN